MTEGKIQIFFQYAFLTFCFFIFVLDYLATRYFFYVSQNGAGVIANPIAFTLFAILLLAAGTGIVWCIKKIWTTNKNHHNLIKLAGFFAALIIALALAFQPIWIVDENGNPLAFSKITVTENLICVESPCNAEFYDIYNGYTLWDGLVFIPIVPTRSISNIVERRGVVIPFYSFKMDGYNLPYDLYAKQKSGRIIQMYKNTSPQ